MSKIKVDEKIMKALDLSDNEGRVFDVILSTKMARPVFTIVNASGLPRSTVVYILKKFEKRGLIEKIPGYRKAGAWRFKKGLEQKGISPENLSVMDNSARD